MRTDASSIGEDYLNVHSMILLWPVCNRGSLKKKAQIRRYDCSQRGKGFVNNRYQLRRAHYRMTKTEEMIRRRYKIRRTLMI